MLNDSHDICICLQDKKQESCENCFEVPCAVSCVSQPPASLLPLPAKLRGISAPLAGRAERLLHPAAAAGALQARVNEVDNNYIYAGNLIHLFEAIRASIRCLPLLQRRRQLTLTEPLASQAARPGPPGLGCYWDEGGEFPSKEARLKFSTHRFICSL